MEATGSPPRDLAAAASDVPSAGGGGGTASAGAQAATGDSCTGAPDAQAEPLRRRPRARLELESELEAERTLELLSDASDSEGDCVLAPQLKRLRLSEVHVDDAMVVDAAPGAAQQEMYVDLRRELQAGNYGRPAPKSDVCQADAFDGRPVFHQGEQSIAPEGCEVLLSFSHVLGGPTLRGGGVASDGPVA